MKLTEEMADAFQRIEKTSEHLFITGKAGVGKTTFLRYIVEHTQKNVIVAASTGIAAVTAGGVTLHSLFRIPPEVQDPQKPLQGHLYKSKIDLFTKLDMLIIDEISMVRPDTLDYIDNMLRLYRMCNQSFGGVQVVMFGDLFQLPPVVKTEEKKILLQFYRGVYFFYANALLKQGFRVIELTQVFRQSDNRFVRILNHIREYKLSTLDIDDLDELRDKQRSCDYNNDNIHICVFKKDVQRINSEMLGTPTHRFEAKLTGVFNQASAPCDITLALRVGARVMMNANDPHHFYFNGSMGRISDIKNNVVYVLLDDSDTPIAVAPYQWEMKGYVLQNGKIETKVVGTCTQLPLTLAWAITIHKSQGLTFDKVSLHTMGIFAPGQLYVALSRCRSMEGLVTESFINQKQIIIDEELVAFNEAVKKHKNIFDRYTYLSMNIK